MPRQFTDEALELIAGYFKLLAEPTRLRILNALREGEKTVTEIVAATGARQANVSKHLALLDGHGMVSRRRSGVNVYCCIADPAIFDLCDVVCDRLEARLERRRDVLGGD